MEHISFLDEYEEQVDIDVDKILESKSVSPSDSCRKNEDSKVAGFDQTKLLGECHEGRPHQQKVA